VSAASLIVTYDRQLSEQAKKEEGGKARNRLTLALERSGCNTVESDAFVAVMAS
jgi:hypothetical protein